MITFFEMIVDRLYRLLLKVFPADVRRAHGEEMVETFRLLRAGRSSQSGRARFTARALGDLVAAGGRERVRRVTAAGGGSQGITGGEMMGTGAADDVKLAFRGLARHPLSAAVLVVTLALGIGANTAVFSVLQAVLLRPLPYEDPHELVTVRHQLTRVPSVGLQGVPGPDLLDYVAGAPSLEALGSVFTLETNLQDDQGAARITIGWVTPGFFDVLRPGTSVGRLLRPEDWTPRSRAQMEDPDFAPPPMPVLLSHDVWAARFGSDSDIVGQSVTINGTRMTVRGVLAEDFHVLGPSDDEVPSRIDAYSYLPIPMTEGPRGGGGGLAVGRLADGASIDQARAELARVAASLVATHEDHARYGTEVVVEPLHEGVVGDARLVLWVLFGAVGLVLLVAVLNVANLQLVRAGARQRDFAVRAALGGGRLRLVRLLLTEGLVLALLGTAAGLALAHWGVGMLVALAPTEVPRLDRVTVDGGVLAVTLVSSLAAAVIFGLAPLATVRADHAGRLLTSSRGVVGGRSTRIRNAVIVGEFAISLALVTGAGLLGRSFQAVRSVDPGYDATGAVAIELALPFFTYRDVERRRAFFDELLDRVRDVPGVTAAGFTPKLPFSGAGGIWSAPYGLTFEELSDESARRANYRAASPGFFEALGARLVSGREFRSGDGGAASELVVIVDRTLAEATWPGESALDQYLQVSVAGYIGPGRQTAARVVGVVEPIRFESLIDPEDPLIWVPYNEYGSLEAAVALRGPAETLTAAAEVRAILDDMDPGVPVYSVRRISEDVRAATATNRFASVLMAVFAICALVLAAVGLYGIVSTMVHGRTKEIGLRLALGARRDVIGGMILRDGARLALTGVILGVGLTLATTPALRGLLVGVEPMDLPTLAATTLFLLVVAGTAMWIPARRASRLDPVEALRCE